MTDEKLMSDNEIRIAVAEKCGWKHQQGLPKEPDRLSWCRKEELCAFQILPNYPNDLNAMHEAEKTIYGTSAWDGYYRWLVCCLDESLDSDLGEDSQNYIHATAHQRAEAFLRVFGLWKEGAS